MFIKSCLLTGLFLASSLSAAILQYGDKDVLGTGTYPSEPTAGATLEGFAPDAVTYANLILPHSYPFSPQNGDYPGTDQIFVGSIQTGNHDGYSSYSGRINGPQTISLDYSSLVPAGQYVDTFTLGIAADDFQYVPFRQIYSATLNGLAAPILTNTLNGFDQTGPRVQFFTIGVPTNILTNDNILTIAIDQHGNGGDGWAIDYLTVGVTTVPEPVSIVMLALGGLRLTRRRNSLM